MKDNPVAVLASGPSLTQHDVDLVRECGLPIIAVNSSWKMARDCVALVAGDYRWWKAYGDEVDIPALRVSRSQKAQDNYGAKRTKSKVSCGYNSGMVAVEWAIRKMYSPIILLGFDASIKDGLHYFGPHERTPNPNEHRVKMWHKHFNELSGAYPKAEIINCSRRTAIDCFPRKTLESVLDSLSQS